MGQDSASTSSPEPDEEDIRATEAGAGHPHAVRHTIGSSDREKVWPPPGYHGTAPLHGAVEKEVCFKSVNYSSQSI